MPAVSSPSATIVYVRARKRVRSDVANLRTALPCAAWNSTYVWAEPAGRTRTLPMPAGARSPSPSSTLAKVHVVASPSTVTWGGKSMCAADGSAEV
ncbi:hypothetical protein ASD08_39215 [Streptomyces sp. Root369]|nr:hypothetical protein ASD08_39215 [Streptomyces sp. Root369]